MIVLIHFLQISQDQSGLVDQTVVGLFHVMGDSLGGIDTQKIREHSIAVLRVGLTRWSTRRSMPGLV